MDQDTKACADFQKAHNEASSSLSSATVGVSEPFLAGSQGPIKSMGAELRNVRCTSTPAVRFAQIAAVHRWLGERAISTQRRRSRSAPLTWPADRPSSGNCERQQTRVMRGGSGANPTSFGYTKGSPKNEHFLKNSYSNTSSASAKSPGGKVRPSIVAALRLRTSLNRVGCSTGRSAGFDPLRILSVKAAARRKNSG